MSHLYHQSQYPAQLSFFCVCALPFGLCPLRGPHRLDPLLSRRPDGYISPTCSSSSSWFASCCLNLAAMEEDGTLWWLLTLRLGAAFGDVATEEGDITSQFLKVVAVRSLEESDMSSSLSLMPPCIPDSSSDRITVSTVNCLCCACKSFSEAMGLSRSNIFLGLAFWPKQAHHTTHATHISPVLRFSPPFVVFWRIPLRQQIWTWFSSCWSTRCQCGNWVQNGFHWQIDGGRRRQRHL